MAGQPSEPSAVNLPNALTTLRLLLVPLFGWLLLREDGTDAASRVAAVVVFIGAMITDWADGRIARDRGLVTSFGKIVEIPGNWWENVGTGFTEVTTLTSPTIRIRHRR